MPKPYRILYVHNGEEGVHAEVATKAEADAALRSCERWFAKPENRGDTKIFVEVAEGYEAIDQRPAPVEVAQAGELHSRITRLEKDLANTKAELAAVRETLNAISEKLEGVLS